jgi:hypothetical protein
LSRHRKVQLSRSKALLVAAGALSVAAASATAATWASGLSAQAATTRVLAVRGHQTILGARETSDVLRLTIPDQLSPPLRPAARAAAARAAEFKAEMAAVQTPAATASPTASASASRTASASPTATATASATASPTVTPQPTATATAPAAGSPQHIAEAMLGSFGWSSSQFACLDPLWAHESGWSVTAHNASSGAYGIPQALPGSKMASAGPDWQTNATTQIKWGLRYIKGTYGSPCAAYSHEQATGWY